MINLIARTYFWGDLGDQGNLGYNNFMKTILCYSLIGISKHKHILHSLWTASHFRVVPYFSMKLFLLMLLSLLFLFMLLLLLYYQRFQNNSLHLTARRLFTEEIENVMLWLANWSQSCCYVEANISYQTINNQQTFWKHFWKRFKMSRKSRKRFGNLQCAAKVEKENSCSP